MGGRLYWSGAQVWGNACLLVSWQDEETPAERAVPPPPAGLKFTRPIRRSKREDGLRRKGGREEWQDARAQDLRA